MPKNLNFFQPQIKVSDYCLIVSLLFIVLTLILPVLTAMAQTEELDRTATQAGFGGQKDVTVIVGKIVYIILAFLGLILVILFIVGGFRWMTSGGNEETIKKARGLMANAVVGAVIVVIAYAIAWFVITRLQGITGGGGGSIVNG